MEILLPFVKPILAYFQKKTEDRTAAQQGILALVDLDNSVRQHVERLQVESYIYKVTGYQLSSQQLVNVEIASKQLEGKVSDKELYIVASKLVRENEKITVTYGVKQKLSWFFNFIFSDGFLYAGLLLIIIPFPLYLFSVIGIEKFIAAYVFAFVLLVLGLVGLSGATEAKVIRKIHKLLSLKKPVS
ncbi:hypothetical protein ABC502_01620 [Alkalimonas sp. NCh-2]|uniref:hypothetical protein n=1 Tax=Alkalimonas sp. NCh-2 TaxID=3144846 RepID=UPI0031F6228A